PVFGFLKANLRFTRMSVRGKSKVENELGFAFMAVNLRKYTAFGQNTSLNYNKKDSSYHFLITGIFFNFIRASYVPAPFYCFLILLSHSLYSLRFLVLSLCSRNR
ncbi:IS5/IS1182 family transposase, partial [Agaribacter marinus]|nr:IS5/IS1182 family transposase [Agaribacter marinus]